MLMPTLPLAASTSPRRTRWPGFYVASALAQMEIAAECPIAVINLDKVVLGVKTIAVVLDVDVDHSASTRCTNIRAHRHGKVVSEFFPITVTHDGSIALNAKMRCAAGPRKTIRRA